MQRKPIDGWELRDRIKRGGQAEVYEATKGEDATIRALKIVRSNYPKKRARFVQEVRKHAELSMHQVANVVPILDHNLDAFEKGNPVGYIVMPKAETTLEQEKELLAFRVDLCLDIFWGIVSGIMEAHNAGIIHRDIKPANILFMDRSLRIPLISDFGICFIKDTPEAHRLTDSHETVGARFFMAPEQERGGRVDVQETADIYALGKLLHFMLTNRNLYRESLNEAFQHDELDADSRLRVIQEKVLATTIIEDPAQRIQTTRELLNVIDQLRRDFGGSTGTLPVAPKNPNPPAPTDSQTGQILATYSQTTKALDEDRLNGIRLHFDQCQQDFRSKWEELRAAIEQHPEATPEAARDLIEAQPEVTGLILAMARHDAVALFSDFKRLIEFITHASEGQPGYVRVHAVPHTLAGFLYMAASVGALKFESWKIFDRLFNTKFEWYYQSGRPLYTFGFDTEYFFHSEALGRRATVSHDLFRAELSRPEILRILGLSSADELLSLYVQTQMLMCLRAAKGQQEGEDLIAFSDFGRFHKERVIPLLDRAYHDRDFALGLCQVFRESPEEWFDKLNERFQIASSRFDKSFWWSSLTTYEPR